MPSGATFLGLKRNSNSGPPAKKGFRLDIQGLRALAVIAVILDHLFKWPTGGYVGVDIFFVISGFLITGILIKEWEKTGRISAREFYTRRVRRILPAAILVTVVTVASAWLIYPTGKFKEIFVDGIWATLFSANWRFASTGTDYFAQGGAPSPLQHYWSLSVEEQFYFVWPWIMLGVLLLVTRKGSDRSKGRGAAAVTLAIISIASFAWALAETSSNPTVAYFSSFTRTWELGVGALLALTAGAFMKIPSALRTVMAWAGVVGMLVSIFVTTMDTPFPAPGAILPVFSAALAIAAGIGGEVKYNYALNNPFSRYVGNISYSLYLWHFPIIILGAAVMPEGGWKYYGAVLVLTAALSIACYHAFEVPLNKSPLLKQFGHHSSKSNAWKKWRQEHGIKMQNWGLGLLAVSTIAAVGMAMAPNVNNDPTVEAGYVSSTKAGGAKTEAPKFEKTTSGKLEEGIYKALQSTAWPTLTPSVDTVLEEGMPEEEGAGCGRTVISDPNSCAFGDPSKPKIVVYGDSLGITLLPTVREAFGADHYVRGLTIAACAVIDVEANFESEERKANCLKHREDSAAYVAESKPDKVFIILNSAWANPKKLASGASGSAMQDEWSAGMESTVKKMSASGAEVFIVSPAPEGKQLVDCATKTGRPANCVADIPTTWNEVSEVESKAKGSKYIDTLHWFCYENACPAFSGKTPIKRDMVHPTRQYAVEVAADFKKMVAAAK